MLTQKEITEVHFGTSGGIADIQEIYLGNTRVRPKGLDKHDKIIIEGRLGIDSTSDRYIGIHVRNKANNYSLVNMSMSTFSNTGIEFSLYNDSGSQVSPYNPGKYGNLSSGMKEYRLTLDFKNNDVKVEAYNTLDVGSPLVSTNTTFKATIPSELYIDVESHDQYYHHGQVEWLRIKDINGNYLLNKTFNDISGGKIVSIANNALSDVSSGWSISGNVMTLSTNPYNIGWLWDGTIKVNK